MRKNDFYRNTVLWFLALWFPLALVLTRRGWPNLLLATAMMLVDALLIAWLSRPRRIDAILSAIFPLELVLCGCFLNGKKETLKRTLLIFTLAALLCSSALPYLRSAEKFETKGESMNVYMVENSRDMLALLREETWATLSERDKIRVLERVKNIECVDQGLPCDEIAVCVQMLNPATNGQYENHMITINRLALEENGSRACVQTLCHEVAHAYQDYYVDLYRSTDPRFSQMAVFDRARTYAYEKTNYVSGENAADYNAYYWQAMEVDARDFAQRAVRHYDEFF